MDQRAKDRIAKNEALFRDVNERVRRIDERRQVAAGTASTWDFLCECGIEGCREAVQLTLEEYESVRSNPVWFFVVPGHERPEVEQVVERNERFHVVEKVGEEQTIARSTDPRA